MCVKCRDLRAGMRITTPVVRSRVVLAQKGAVVSEPLIRLLLFFGVKRVRVEETAFPGGLASPLAAPSR